MLHIDSNYTYRGFRAIMVENSYYRSRPMRSAT